MIEEKSITIRDDISPNDCGQYMIRFWQELWILEIGPLFVGRTSIRIKEIQEFFRFITFDQRPVSYLPWILVQQNRPIRKLVIISKIRILVDTKWFRGDFGHQRLQVQIR
jgi:hypothetical protein